MQDHALDVTPFTLPLTRVQFEIAIQKGQGRALMHVLQHDATGYEDLILDACRHSKVYDTQCEVEREPWLMKITEAADLTRGVNDIVVEDLQPQREGEYSRDYEQLVGLAFELAKMGFEDSRKALYAALQKRKHSWELVVVDEILELDDSVGLIHVAQKFGEWLEQDPDFEVDDRILDRYDDMHTKGDGLRVLQESAKSDAEIARYLTHLQRLENEKEERKKQKRQGRERSPGSLVAATPNDIIEYINSDVGFRFPVWSRNASVEDLRIIMERMFAEREPARLLRYLFIFIRRAMPEFDQRLLAFAEHSDLKIRWRTYRVLSQNVHPSIRKLALSRIQANRVTEGELGLLQENHEHGDWSIIKASVTLPEEPYAAHTLLLDLLDLYEANLSDESVEPMLAVYEYSPCSLCRGRAYKALEKLGAVPQWMATEWQFDSCNTKSK